MYDQERTTLYVCCTLVMLNVLFRLRDDAGALARSAHGFSTLLHVVPRVLGFHFDSQSTRYLCLISSIRIHSVVEIRNFKEPGACSLHGAVHRTAPHIARV
jgi:hypothetical protein